MPELRTVHAAQVRVDYTIEHISIRGVVDGIDVEFRLDPVSAMMVGASLLEIGKVLTNKTVLMETLKSNV